MRTVAISWEPTAGRFVALGSHASHAIAINAPRGEDETRGSTGFSATELLLAGAGSCAAWDVVEILRKRRHDMISLQVTVEGEQAPDPPWEYRRVALHFRIQGRGLRRNVVERVVRLSCDRYCSVLSSLRGVARVEATLELVDASGESRGRRPVFLAPAVTSGAGRPVIDPALVIDG